MEEKYEGTKGQLLLLDDALASLAKSETLKGNKDSLESQGKKLNKELASGQKKMSSEIESTIKKRRNEVAAEYDKEIDAIEGKLKKVRSNREKARNSGIKERTKGETAEFHGENRELKYQYKDMIKTSGIPAFCGSKLFNILYSPVSVDEYLTFILLAVACLFGVPTLVLYLTHLLEKQIVCIIMYVVFILLFIALYILVYAFFKRPYAEIIREGRSMRKRITHNQKTIKKISNDIKKDDNDSQYGLGEFDYDIAKFEGQIEEINNKKKEALDTFDNVTSKVITDEITAELKPAIDTLEAQLKENQAQTSAVSLEADAHNKYVEENYMSVLGKEFMTKERIAVLRSILLEGNAASVSDAIAFFKNSKMG